ncbi:MAG: hypothetical protein MI757_14020 [Pirellulales bacterium]|nr:hypothetical protein [Pirellulales bacterium]
MLKLDVTIHARPASTVHGEAIEIDGRTVRPLACASGEPFAIGFDEAAGRLAALDEMIHLEPDGWFIWHSPKNQSPVWQINGNLYDRQQCLWYVPLRGTCPPQVLDRVLSAFSDSPSTELMFELTHAGIFVDLASLQQQAVQVDAR